MENIRTSKATLILGIVGIVLGLLSPILGLIPAVIGLVMNLKNMGKYGKAGAVLCVCAILVCIVNAAVGMILFSGMMG